MAATTIRHPGVIARSRVAGTLIAAQLTFWCASSTAGPLESLPVASGLSAPVFVTAPQGDPRLFIVEKGGVIKIRSGGSVLPTPFLSISVRNDGESGLLGMAFDPNFAAADPNTPGYRTFYVNYIHPSSGNTVVASYRVSDNPNVADTSTARTVLSVAQPAGRSNHKAGWIGFRPDEPDNLYIATGDGGSSNDPENRAQSLNDNLGKILRVNVRADDFSADANRNYAIPTDNPFKDTAGNDEIWAYGLRNPYRNSFDRMTGDFYIADVGQGAREELNFEPSDSDGGANYGWRAFEGSIENPGRLSDPNPSNATPPILDYGRSVGATIIGGYVARGGYLGEFEGAYLFGDYVEGRIWAIPAGGSLIDIAQATDVTDIFNLDPETGERLIGERELSSFGEDGFGRLYLVGYDGNIYAMVPEPATWAMLLAALVPVVWIARRRGVAAA